MKKITQIDGIPKPCKCGNFTFTHRHSNWIECTKCHLISILVKEEVEYYPKLSQQEFIKSFGFGKTQGTKTEKGNPASEWSPAPEDKTDSVTFKKSEIDLMHLEGRESQEFLKVKSDLGAYDSYVKDFMIMVNTLAPGTLLTPKTFKQMFGYDIYILNDK